MAFTLGQFGGSFGVTKRQEHEKNFKSEFAKRYGAASLSGKQRYPEPGVKGRENAAEVSSDESFQHSGWMVLIEIDAFNVAKPSLGQYFLINHLCTHDRNKTIFLVLNHYKNFNEQRTNKYLRFACANIGIDNPIKYLAMTKEQFWNLCDTCSDVDDLLKELIKKALPNTEKPKNSPGLES